MMWKSMVVGVALAMAAPGSAAMVTSTDPQSIVSVLQAKGYQAELGKDADGDPVIHSAAGGAHFTVLFAGCTKGSGCTSIQFYTGFKAGGSVPVTKINEWNRTKRFNHAYLDKENDPCIEMDIDLDMGGVSPALFGDQVELWAAILGDFRKFVS